MFLPGLLAAVVFHSLFNHFLISPPPTVVGLVLVLPLLLVVVFQQSERRVQRWLGAGMDADADLLAMGPFLRWRTRDLWQLHMLGTGRRRHRRR